MQTTMQPSALDRRARRHRVEPNPPWSLARQGTPWTDVDKASLSTWWTNETMATEQIAALLERSTASIRLEAYKLDLGGRPYEQGYGKVGAKPGPKPPRLTAKERPVELKPTFDGVVMTPRLRAAWERVCQGEAIDALTAELKLQTVEILALRRWRNG